MAKDPVCGMEVDEQKATEKVEYKDQRPTTSAHRAAGSPSRRIRRSISGPRRANKRLTNLSFTAEDQGQTRHNFWKI
jgi:hypothetical protein